MTENNALRAEKRRLRREYQSRAAALPAAYRLSAGETIAALILSDARWASAGSVFLFFSLPTEPDTAALFAAAFAAHKTVYVPKCVTKTEMLAVRFTPHTPLLPDAFGIPAPEGRDAAKETPGLILAPCVAADRRGVRLGHGAGYYDRFLAAHAAPALCLCFDALCLPALPAETTDVRLPVVTERGIFAP